MRYGYSHKRCPYTIDLCIEEGGEGMNDDQLNPIYVLYGEETYLLETTLKKIKKQFGERIDGINYIELDEENFITSLMPEIQTPPFGYDKKMIVAKNTGLFKKETKKVAGLKELRDTLSDYLKENIEQIKNSLLLVFVEDSVQKLNITNQVEAIRWKSYRV